MELKAENKITVDQKLFKEGMHAVMERDYFPMAKKATIALAALWLLIAGVLVYNHANLGLLVIELLVLAAVCVWMYVILPRSRYKRGWTSFDQRANGDMDRLTRFYEDRMEVTSGSGVLIVNYEDIVSTKETEHMLILFNKDKVGVMLALDGFTLGGKDVVLKLIEEWSV